MTPLTLGLLLPASALTAAGIAVFRIDWRQYPAWVAAMLWQVFIHGATLGGRTSPAWAIPVSAALLAWMVVESAAKSREKVGESTRARLFSFAFCGSAALSSIAAGLSTMQRAYLFRSYFLLAAALSMIALCALRMWCPVLERQCDKIYRLGIALWITGMAVSGSFVKGGLGYLAFPHTAKTWAVVNFASYAWVIILLPSMSLAMAASLPGRKRAAKRRDGRTATGLIEMQRAA